MWTALLSDYELRGLGSCPVCLRISTFLKQNAGYLETQEHTSANPSERALYPTWPIITFQLSLYESSSGAAIHEEDDA